MHKETNLSSSLKISQTNDARKPNAKHSLQPVRPGQLKDAKPSPAPPTGVVILPDNSAHIPEAYAAK